MTAARTPPGFWDACRKGLALATVLDPKLAFDRCLSRGLDALHRNLDLHNPAVMDRGFFLMMVAHRPVTAR